MKKSSNDQKLSKDVMDTEDDYRNQGANQLNIVNPPLYYRVKQNINFFNLFPALM